MNPAPSLPFSDDTRGNVTSTRYTQQLPDTAPLEVRGDPASDLVQSADAFLLRQIERFKERRTRSWDVDQAPSKREILADRLGIRDARRDHGWTPLLPPLLEWSAFGDVHGAGVWAKPDWSQPQSAIIVLPDADQSPEQLFGQTPGIPEDAQFARKLATNTAVYAVGLVRRAPNVPGELGDRERLQRSSFVLGRTVVGYEVQLVLSLVDMLLRSANPPEKLGLMGWGEGGRVALYAAALDPRISAVCVSGYFGPRERVWDEPFDRNVFGLLESFGDAELAALVAPRHLIVEASRAPETCVPPGGRAKPGRIVTPELDAVRAELVRARTALGKLDNSKLVVSGDGTGLPGSTAALTTLLRAVGAPAQLPERARVPRLPEEHLRFLEHRPARLARQLERHNTDLLATALGTREKRFWKLLNTKDVPSFQASTEPLREVFRAHLGVTGTPLPALHPRPRLWDQTAAWRRYEVSLEAVDEVPVHGLLTIPSDLEPGERRPVVVCLHGLEGRPSDLAEEKTYRRFVTRLVEQGFITFAPQQLYVFGDRFRTLQFKANALGMSIFSLMVQQHRQLVRWLQTRPEVAPDRIGLYGFSYGGKSVMRIMPQMLEYRVGICSGDFNDWIDKCASTINPRSYVHTGEYEMFEWDLASTFNYAEMAALICPRPFMVERGHSDDVADDWTVGWEYARVRNCYARLGLDAKTEIEWFSGGHEVLGQGTFAFLCRELRGPGSIDPSSPKERAPSSQPSS